MYLKSAKKDDNTICDTYMQITYSAPTLFCTFFCVYFAHVIGSCRPRFLRIHTYIFMIDVSSRDFSLESKKSADFARFTSNGGK